MVSPLSDTKMCYELNKDKKKLVYFSLTMQKQSEIVASRKRKAARLSTVCHTPKAFKMKKPPKSSVLFGYAPKESLMEIAQTEVGLAFIERYFEKFKRFARQMCVNSEVERILQGAALENYTKVKLANKANEEIYRTHAMGIVLQYSKLQLPVMTHHSLGTWLRIVEIRTSCIICSDNQTYELVRTIPIGHGWAQFGCKEKYVRVDNGYIRVAHMLLPKLNGLVNIVSQIMVLAGGCTIY